MIITAAASIMVVILMVVMLRESGVTSIPGRSAIIADTLEYWFTRVRG
jgi:hypothetical protein